MIIKKNEKGSTVVEESKEVYSELNPKPSEFVTAFKDEIKKLKDKLPQTEHFTNIFITKQGKLLDKFKVTEFRKYMKYIDMSELKKQNIDEDAIVLTTYPQYVGMSGYIVETEVDKDGYNKQANKYDKSTNKFWEKVAIWLGDKYNPQFNKEQKIEFIYILRKYSHMKLDLYGLEVFYKEIANMYNEEK